MYELIQVGEKTYYINCPAKMGIYRINDRDVYLIDSGNDKEAGKKIQKIMLENNWSLKAIINTHSHADHIGGNNLLQQRMNCEAYSTRVENVFIHNPILEPSLLYGGYPCKELRNKFLMANPSNVLDINEVKLSEGIEIVPLNGHSFSMIGIKTSDNIWFLADCLTGEEILNKYHVSFLYDVEAYLQTLKIVEELQGELFIPAHAEPTKNIKNLVEINRSKIYEVIDIIIQICKTPNCFEDILKGVFDHYGLTMDFNQYVLVGSTIRSYLSYLYDIGKLKISFNKNRLLWEHVGEQELSLK